MGPTMNGMRSGASVPWCVSLELGGIDCTRLWTGVRGGVKGFLTVGEGPAERSDIVQLQQLVTVEGSRKWEAEIGAH